MQIIGLTGGIACGKSTISATLRRLGAVIVDGDVLSRELTRPEGIALPDIRARFGEGVFHEDGSLNRRALGNVIFSDDAARTALDGIMQPLLYRLILQGIDEAREAGAAVCVLDMPLLYEKDLDHLCNAVWCAFIPREMQLERLMARDGFTRQQAEDRLASQLPADEKAARADVVIDTRGSIEETANIVTRLFRQTAGGL